MIPMLQRERKRGSGGTKLTFAFRPCASAFTFADCIPPRRRERSRSASASEQPRGVCGYSSVSTRVDRCARAELEDGDGRYRDGTSGVLEVRGIRGSEGARFVEVECQLVLRFLSCLG